MRDYFYSFEFSINRYHHMPADIEATLAMLADEENT